MRTSTWWRSNRLWLVLLLPALALALAASSFRFSALYLRWEWSQPTLLRAPGAYTQTFSTGTHTLQRTVEVGVAAVERAVEVEGEYAAGGTALWRVALDFAAAPDQILATCEIELEDAAGIRYGVRGAKVNADGDPDSTWVHRGCTPADTPGPTVDFDGQVREADTTRPQRWQVVTSVAVPAGVEPTLVRVMWDRPGYLRLTIPR
ncbi:MAG TPA: hypothetical protein PLA49_12640 [Propioniciclava sp.]|jgi:hypothetical protein|uniref:hypothetical protein n=1 Tax=Propioniciclava sp. TaxID=2038686 RepID=UPI002C42B017|nr:hypothetical protein [Propioniciclava sp.]HRL50210.1 hypothetical protein [Propioniciclava sp.]